MIYQVNILPLIIGAVFNMALGALWYSPVLFAKPWMKEAGITKENMEASQGKMGKVYLSTTIMSFITSYIIGFVIINMGVTTILNAIVVAVFVFLAFSFPMAIKNWGFEDRTLKLGMINHGYDLVVYLVVAVLYVLL